MWVQAEAEVMGGTPGVLCELEWLALQAPDNRGVLFYGQLYHWLCLRKLLVSLVH